MRPAKLREKGFHVKATGRPKHLLVASLISTSKSIGKGERQITAQHPRRLGARVQPQPAIQASTDNFHRNDT
jgi:hypothetical protein